MTFCSAENNTVVPDLPTPNMFIIIYYTDLNSLSLKCGPKKRFILSQGTGVVKTPTNKHTKRLKHIIYAIHRICLIMIDDLTGALELIEHMDKVKK